MENLKFARKCSVTGEGMNQGWIFGDGESYAQHEHDALKISMEIGYNSIQDAYDDDACYWTEWEDKDDSQYELINGVLVEIEE